jgi:hypothetical protein
MVAGSNPAGRARTPVDAPSTGGGVPALRELSVTLRDANGQSNKAPRRKPNCPGSRQEVGVPPVTGRRLAPKVIAIAATRAVSVVTLHATDTEPASCEQCRAETQGGEREPIACRPREDAGHDGHHARSREDQPGALLRLAGLDG